MSDEALRPVLSGRAVILSRMTPEHKLRVVNILKDSGDRVAMTGDGVNDAPALKRADMGVAMGSGTDVAKEAADMVLIDDNFVSIVDAIEEGKAVYENIRKFISYVFTSNVAEVMPYIFFIVFKLPLALTIIQILAIDLGTDMLPALALGAERPTPEVSRTPPRAEGKRLLDLPVVARVFFFLAMIESASGFSGFFHVLYSSGWKWGEQLAASDPVYIRATTACLAGIAVAQAANVFQCRSFRESVFRIGFFSNWLIFPGVAFEILLLLFIIYTPFGNGVFSTAPLGWDVWLVLAPFALLLFFAEELRKLMARRFFPEKKPSI